MSFESFDLSPEILRAVAEEGYTEPTPVQQRAIPTILAGDDVMVGAQTGTGKTAGFALPLLHLLQSRPHAGKHRQPRVLILTPTRELTAQVGDSVKAYSRHLPLRTAIVYGGVKLKPQIDQLRKGVDIVVATPGRLLDHAGQKNVDLSAVEYLVLDEADRMLDMGFIQDIRRIIALMPARRQNLLFSATFSPDIERLAASFLNDPQRIQIARRNSAAEGVVHTVHPVDRSRKRELLIKLIKTHDWPQVLIFVNMKQSVDRLAQWLNKAGIQAAPIHGDKNQGQRTRALADFKKGKLRVLVATDVASRGLDIEDLPYVVNYELPEEVENYVHRIGRTGRAGRIGEAVSLVAADEMALLEEIEVLLDMEINREVIPGFEPDPRIKVVGTALKRRYRSSPDPFPASGDGKQDAPAEHWSKRVGPKGGGETAV
jgi:ATP-dependent RNA helicase RhlE